MLPSKTPLRTDLKSRLAAAVIRLPEAGSATRILIIDQDRKLGVTLSFMLAARRFDEVRAVRSARRAVAVAEQFQPEIVFLDVELPDGGGIPLARQLVARDARKPRPRLIALTKNAVDAADDQLRAAGFERLLLKPVSQDDLDRIMGISRTAA